MTKETYLTSKGVEVKSKEEQYFEWWLRELEGAGIIESYKYEPPPFLLSSRVTQTICKQLKTKTKFVDRTLLREHRYTLDFLIFWNKTPKWLYAQNLISHVDVKGSYARNFNDIAFGINQKWLYNDYGIYVQKVVPTKLFARSFTPKRYLLTDKSNKPRKINFKVTLLEDIL